MAPNILSRRPKGLPVTKSTCSRKLFKRQCLVVFLGIGVVVLMMLQLTTLARHSVPQHEGPLNLALREPRQSHTRQVSQRQKERSLQRDPQTIKKSDRRRLNTTHGNRSNTEKAAKADIPKRPSTGDIPLKFMNKTFKLRKRKDGQKGYHKFADGHANGWTKAAENVTQLLTGRRRNTTKLQRTHNPTNLTANDTMATMKVRRPFQLKRSIPAPPWDFKNRTMPPDPLSPHFDISTLKRTNYTLKSKWHGVLLDAGRHYFEVDWIKRMLDMLAVLQYNCLHFRLTDDQSFNVLLKSQPDLAHNVGLFGNNKTYTPDELKDIVAYGKTKGITIWPEINVPVS